MFGIEMIFLRLDRIITSLPMVECVGVVSCKCHQRGEVIIRRNIDEIGYI